MGDYEEYREKHQTLSVIFQKSSFYVDAEKNWLGIKITNRIILWSMFTDKDLQEMSEHWKARVIQIHKMSFYF